MRAESACGSVIHIGPNETSSGTVRYMDAQAKKQGHPVRVLSFLREPGTRAASQVLFWNTFKWPLFQRLAVKMGETCLEDGIG